MGDFCAARNGHEKQTGVCVGLVGRFCFLTTGAPRPCPPSFFCLRMWIWAWRPSSHIWDSSSFIIFKITLYFRPTKRCNAYQSEYPYMHQSTWKENVTNMLDPIPPFLSRDNGIWFYYLSFPSPPLYIHSPCILKIMLHCFHILSVKKMASFVYPSATWFLCLTFWYLFVLNVYLQYSPINSCLDFHICIYQNMFFIYSPLDGHLACFQHFLLQMKLAWTSLYTFPVNTCEFR